MAELNAPAAFYINNGDYEKANDYLLAASQRLPQSSLLTARLLLQKVWVGQATEQDFVQAGERLRLQQFDAQTVKSVRTLVEHVVSSNVASNSADYARYSLNLLEAMESSPVYGQFPLFVRLVAYLRARLYLHIGDVAQAYEYYSLAMSRYQETDAALAMVAEMGSAGYPQEALSLLVQANEVLARQDSRKLRRSRASYEQDVAYLEDTLKEAQASQGSAMEAP